MRRTSLIVVVAALFFGSFGAGFLPALSPLEAGFPGVAEAGPWLNFGEGARHWVPSLWAVVPFALMLLSIALVPLINEHWWENDRNRGAICAVLGIPVLLYVLNSDLHGQHRILHTAIEYTSFLVLLGSLFVISGGIVITGNLQGTPLVNTAFLAVGALMASFIGTTGAAMLLIRPILNTNSERRHVVHTVLFFIFIVCNCGGCLTPLGDPPLFLGYLKGVPFGWTFGLVVEWAFVCAVLLVVYFVFDVVQHRKETKKDIQLDVEHERPIIVRGAHNFLFLGGVVLAVAWTDVFSFPSREGFMVLMAVGAWFTTRSEYRAQNRFSFAPIREVAVVFAGIFSTMIPALALLQAKGDALGVTDPTQFFWSTGALSAFLDNAPTYLSFLALGNGVSEWSPALMADSMGFANGHAAFGSYAEVLQHFESAGLAREDFFALPQPILTGISLGAVFMGAMTYIGNGPNFMVRAIASNSGVKMPSFFGYILWSAVILLPLFFGVTWIFFH